MKIAVQSIAIICFWAGASAAQDLLYADDATQACLEDTAPEDRAACAGKSAEACMRDTPGGETTVGMGGCLDGELKFWDGSLNAAYAALMAVYQASDAEAMAGGWSTPEQVPALKAMQRAWITYRDTRCDFERAKWGGGTGGGPATLQCLMTVTAAQTVVLQDGLDGLQ